MLPTLVTTWLCFTEAMHLVNRAGGYAAQETLWGYVDDGLVVPHDLSTAERARMRVLMGKYSDTPMDLADASLVAVAETLNVRRVFTVDSDFLVYRTRGDEPFAVVP